jgi:antitoxin component YwqK of YwqJK toxin-antitoxin module
MNNLGFLVLVFPTLLFSFSYNDDFEQETSLFNNHRNQEVTKSVPNYFSGMDRSFYPDGKIRYEIGYYNGQKDGMEKSFYPDGKIRYEIGWYNGRKDGMEKYFYRDGKLKSEISYRNGRKDGMAKEFFRDGRIKSEIIYKQGRVYRIVQNNDYYRY